MYIIWHHMSFNYFDMFICARLSEYLHETRSVLIINNFAPILRREDDMVLT